MYNLNINGKQEGSLRKINAKDIINNLILKQSNCLKNYK